MVPALSGARGPVPRTPVPAKCGDGASAPELLLLQWRRCPGRERSIVRLLRHSVFMPRRSRYDSQKLDKIREDQRLVILRSQARECGMPSSTIDDKIAPSGAWQVLLPGVYLTTAGGITREHREIAALLYAGEGSIITGACAASRHGLTASSTDIVDVLVDLVVRRQSRGLVRLHRSLRVPKTWTEDGPIRFADAPRAVADAARGLKNLDDVRSLVYEAVQKRACSIDELLTELRDGPRQGSSFLQEVLAELVTGVRTGAERVLQQLLARGLGKLPQPIFNAKLFTLDGQFIAMVDAYWEAQSLAGEVDSKAYHLSVAAQDRDRDRHKNLIAHGVTPMHFSPQRIHNDSSGVLRDVRAALESNSGRPPLLIVAVGPDENWTKEAVERVRKRLAAYQAPAATAGLPQPQEAATRDTPTAASQF